MKINCLACLLAGLVGAVMLLTLQAAEVNAQQPSATSKTTSESKNAENNAAKSGETIHLADGALSLTAPGVWQRVRPRTNIVEFEFSATPVGSDKQAGRLTIMGAGGSVQANIDRWLGQFVQPGGGSSKEAAKLEVKKIAGLEVHVVDVSGTYLDTPGGPFAGGKVIERQNYRMLAAIILGGPKVGNYFLKFYGPQETISANAEAFEQFVDSLKKN